MAKHPTAASAESAKLRRPHLRAYFQDDAPAARFAGLLSGAPRR
jgi:hypothetical protein